MTVTEMQVRLHSRGLEMRVFEAHEGLPWIVHLSTKDDPGLGVITGEGRSLEEAFGDGIKQWDGLLDDEEGEIAESGEGFEFSLNPRR